VREGNPGKRKLKIEPMPKKGIPEKPKWLLPEARAEWDRVVPELERLGLLSKIDGAALAGYCQNWARAIKCEKRLEHKGMTMKTQSGYEQQRPEVAMAQKYWALVKVFCSEYGLTPASRVRLGTPGEPKKRDSLDALLGTGTN